MSSSAAANIVAAPYRSAPPPADAGALSLPLPLLSKLIRQQARTIERLRQHLASRAQAVDDTPLEAGATRACCRGRGRPNFSAVGVVPRPRPGHCRAASEPIGHPINHFVAAISHVHC
jgi:hypothetical protein